MDELEELRARVRELEAELEGTASSAREDNAAHLALLVDAERIANVGSWDWDLRTGEITWSPQLYRIFGLDPSRGSPTAEDFFARVHPDDRARIEAGAAEGSETGNFGATECRIVRDDGEIREVVMDGTTWRDPDTGAPFRVVGALVDLTERVRAERDLARIEAQLRQSQKMEALGRLAGGVAHDFNNVLTIVLGSVDVHGARCPIAQDDLEQVRQAVTSAGELTRSLIAFSRPPDLRAEPIDVGQLVTQSSKMLERVLGTGVRMTLDVDQAAPLVSADEHHVQQALVNLVINARDAMPDGGTIRLSVRRGADARPGPDPDDVEHVVVEVVDDGVGMPAEVLERATEPFFTTKPEGQGSGLGLSIVYGMVTRCGGYLDVSSEQGAGSRVSLYLPVAPAG